MGLDHKTRRRIFNRIRMRFVRSNRDLEDTKVHEEFESELAKAYAEEEKRIELGLPKHTYKVQQKHESPEMPKPEPEPIEQAKTIEEFASRIGKRDKGEFESEPSKSEPTDNMGFDNLEPVINRAFGKSESEKQAENKELEKGVNELLEREITRGLCPKCHSSVCHCHENEEGELE